MPVWPDTIVEEANDPALKLQSLLIAQLDDSGEQALSLTLL
jgi:hypothetical protein